MSKVKIVRYSNIITSREKVGLLLNKNELLHATNCDGNCNLCDMSGNKPSQDIFDCTKVLAKEVLELQKALEVKMFADSEAAKLVQENRKLKIYAELILNALNIANDKDA